MCSPPKKEVLKRTKNIAKQIKAKSVFVATDNDAMLDELTKALKKLGVHCIFWGYVPLSIFLVSFAQKI